MTVAVIDLQRRYDIRVSRDPARGNFYVARDLVTFDPDPDSPLHIEGVARSDSDARLDLLERLAAIAVIFDPATPAFLRRQAD